MSLKRLLLAGSIVSMVAMAPGCADEDIDSTVDDLTSTEREQVFTDRAELNISTVAVTRLARALNQDWAEKKKSCSEWSGIRDSRLREVYAGSEDLAREFGDVLETDDDTTLQIIYKGLREVLHNATAIRRYDEDLADGNFRAVFLDYKENRYDLVRQIGDVFDDDEYMPRDGEMPTIVVNVAAETVQLFYDGFKIHDEGVVVGQRDYDNYNQNSKTRVGDHAIASWHHCYSNADYPAWCDDKKNGAFGEWTMKLDRGFQYLHGSIGGTFLNWAAIKFAPGSHGCVRNRNKHISWMHDIAPVDTPVRKIYAATERYAKVRRDRNKSTGTSGRCKQDPFGDNQPVRFYVSEAKNHYKYDLDNYPETLAESDRSYKRPNGVYYKDVGVTVGYAHPTDAVLQPF
jgi:hypothetical protein